VRTVAQLRLLVGHPAVARVRVLAISEDPDEAAREAARRGLEAATGCSVAPPLLHPVHVKAHPAFLPALAWERARGRPYVAAKWDSAAVRARLAEELTGAPYDVVWLDHLGTMVFLDDVRRLAPRARVVLDEHNVETEFFSQLTARVPPWLRPVARWEENACRAFERAALEAADAVVALSQADAAAFRQLAGVDAALVPPMVVPRRRPFAAGAPAVCFVGALSWRPNAEGVTWLCDEVFPHVVAADPELRLLVCGALPAGPGGVRVPAAWRRPFVELCGFVPDLESVYRQSFAMVAPVVGGSGVRIKLLEGMGAGLPVLTNRDGAHGLPLRDGAEVLIEDDPRRFAQRLVALRRDATLAQRLTESAYHYLERHHGPAAALGALSRALGVPAGS
jgi:glycosyltransferase involved in cell wall biosynthesis